MAIADCLHRPHSERKLWRLCPFWQSGTASSSTQNLHSQIQSNQNGAEPNACSTSTVSSVARSLIPARRRLRFDPANNLYFPYEPGKKVTSAVRIKNTTKSHVAFKFQTTAPKCCYMRPPGGVLAPGESIVAIV